MRHRLALVILGAWLLGVGMGVVGASFTYSPYEYKHLIDSPLAFSHYEQLGWEIVPNQPNKYYIRRARVYFAWP